MVAETVMSFSNLLVILAMLLSIVLLNPSNNTIIIVVSLLCTVGTTSIVLRKVLKENIYNLMRPKAPKIGKKILATGNGKCNLGNLYYSTRKNIFNDDFALNLIKKFDINDQRAFFLECGFTTKIINELCYPTSESASSFINGLVNYAKSLGVNFILETTFLDYQNINNNLKVMTTPKLNNEIFDKLIITTGGKSSPKMGSDGNVFNIL